jgi:putative membrane protein
MHFDLVDKSVDGLAIQISTGPTSTTTYLLSSGKWNRMDIYLWVKAMHVISVIAWMAGLFYLPRLFVYHAAKDGAALHDTFVVMERRLLRAIMNPAMVSTWVFGLWLVYLGAVDWSAAWAWTKLLAVLGMTGFHMWLAGGRRAFAEGRNVVSERGWRIANEVPTVLMIAIVFAVIVKF